MTAFVAYNPQKTVPTTAAAQFARDLVTAGFQVYNFGIGQESVRAPTSLFPDNITVSHGPDYNGPIGGSVSLRDTAAHYLNHFLGIGAQESNTFVLSQNGRVPLTSSLMFLASRNPAETILLPKLRWPTYDAIVKILPRLRIINYENPTSPTLVDLDLSGNFGKHPLAMVINSPHNPTGAIYPPRWMKAVSQSIEAHQKPDKQPMTVILDNPYFYALPDAEGSASHQFDGGYEYLTKPDGITPWIAIISFSKALGMAHPGLSLVAVHPSIAGPFKEQLLVTGGGSYNPNFYQQVERALSPDTFAIHTHHYEGLRTKYALNYGTLRTAFSNSVVPGGPGMTALVEVPDILNKRVTYDGKTYEVRTTADAIECIGNVSGVVIVDQGQTKSGVALIRVAAAEEPTRYAEGVAKLKEAIALMQNAPRLTL